MATIPESVVQAFRSRRPRSFAPVSLGYRTVELIAADQLTEAQVGYAVDASGRSLISDDTGAWTSEWLVVAREDELGDPIFADISDPAWAILTAPHGTGHWEPEQIADSFENFVAALELVRQVSHGRENPVARETNPVSPSDRERVLTAIAGANAAASLTFWETWLEEL